MERKYNGGLTREQFLFFETKILAELLTQGYSQTEAIDRIVAENLFQFPTERMIKTIANACLRRLNLLESDGADPMLGKVIVRCRKADKFICHGSAKRNCLRFFADGCR